MAIKGADQEQQGHGAGMQQQLQQQQDRHSSLMQQQLQQQHRHRLSSLTCSSE